MSVPIELSQMLQDVRIAQRSAWEFGEKVFVEDYLHQQPELAQHDDSVLDLIYSEYCLREELGHRPDPIEYMRRFPQWADSLQRLFELHRAIEASDKTALDTGLVQKRTLINHASAEQPTHIGRYRINRLLGEGGFGLVYLAEDDQLQRLVAIKVPHAHLVARADEAKVYVAEARTVASLDHPHIVPVYDVGSTDLFPCFVVSKFIDGTDLASKLKRERLSPHQSAQLIATVAEALHHAHHQGLVHRDIKPANILLDQYDQPFVADFGLAQREQDIGTGPRHVGTPQYMSPEQARGEGHRVDGRSDQFSLGVVLYELLVGQRPFKSESKQDLLQQITDHEPRPPRQCDEMIPKELDRICLKALSKRTSERYSSARDMADDLRHFLSQSPTSTSVTADTARPWSDGSVDASSVDATRTPVSARSPIKIIPKGFRSYDAHDADFFLELLPGSRDRDGLPDSIRFWKNRIEELDADLTFSVGLIYGPSGCGKTSLVKAGLLPQLSSSMTVVYVESTEHETETRLHAGLRKRFPALPKGLSLTATLASLRRGHGIATEKKVVIILDQFEQWLHAKSDKQDSELVQALRQCDGGQVQCIVMVRDDFWMAVTRFMAALEIPLREGENSAPVDLFPIRHAEKVLAAFGRAFGNLPADTKDITREQQAFLKQAVASLAQDGKVISVRLALFAEMMKGKPWTPAALKQAGGTEGIRVTFLEETFCAAHAPPEHRYHQQAARSVLKAMLPESGADIRGHMRAYHELLDASGYQGRAKDFDDLLRILDSELRLITPTDPEGNHEPTALAASSQPTANPNAEPVASAVGSPEIQNPKSSIRYFQLTHDYLVPSLRDWLTGKQKETRRGRAELLLADRAAVWNARSENRQLPSLAQWIQIRALTQKTKWTSAQRKMMKKAGRYHLIRGVVVGSLVAVATFAGLTIREKVVAKQSEAHAVDLVSSLLKAEFDQVAPVINELKDYREWAEPILAAKLNGRSGGTSEKLRLALAMLPADDRQVEYLSQQLPICTLEQFGPLRAALSSYRDKISGALWQVVLNDEQNPSQRLQAAAALAEYAPNDERWYEAAPLVVQQLTGVVSMVSLAQWRQWFKPVGGQLTNSLMQVQADRRRSKEQIRSAGYLLADYLHNEPLKLIDVILIAEDPAEFALLVKALPPHATEIKQVLLDELRAVMPEQLEVTNLQLSEQDQQLRDAHWKRQSLAAVTLVSLGFGKEVWPLLQFSPNPSLRSFIIHYLGSLGTDPNTLAAQLRIERDVTIRQALIQAIGGLDSELLTPSVRNGIADHLKTLYLGDPDSGIHSSAEWALRKWDVALPKLPIERREDQNWYVTTHGQTMVMILDPSTPEDVQNNRGFAMASHETTMGEFRQFRPGYSTDLSAALTDEHPAISVSFYMAAEYCNWLSELEGIPEDQWVFEPNGQGKFDDGMIVRENGLELTGYRLPSEAEWEIACRAGTSGSHVFGEPVFLLDRYGWYTANASGRSHPVASLLPNANGLFDVHGASWEWTQPSEAGSESVVRSQIEGVMRGGAFRGLVSDLRSTSRKKVKPNNRLDFNGFRVAKTFASRDGITRP